MRLAREMVTSDGGVRTSCEIARMARETAIRMIHAGGEGHYGGSLSLIDTLSVLFCSVFDPDRDRFILSKGHAAPGYYAVLHELGVLDPSKLTQYGAVGAALQGHPDMVAEPAVQFSTGSLGQGISVALGMSLVLRPRGGRVWVMLGDGECQEGQVWEAAMLASRIDAANLSVIIDRNDHQEWGFRRDGKPESPILGLADKWHAFGFEVREIDGHNHSDLRIALERTRSQVGKPSVTIARTVKGFGAPLLESDPDRFHCGKLNEDEFVEVLESLR